MSRAGLVFVSLLLLSDVRLSASPVTVVNSGNATISADSTASTWTLSTNTLNLVLNVGRDIDFAIAQFTNASKAPWVLGTTADTVVMINGKRLVFGRRLSGFSLHDVSASTHGTQLQLDAAYDLVGDGVRMTRHYAIVSGAAAVETWTTYQSLGSPATLSDLNALRLTLSPGTAHWITGLQGDNATVDQESAFTRRSKRLNNGDQLTLGSTGRSSETAVPWIAIAGSNETWFASLLWSGAWTLDVSSVGDAMSFSLGLGTMTTTLDAGGAVDGPHVVMGVVSGGVAQASAALRSYTIMGIRQGRQVTPLVTYNTWFAFGTDIDEATMEAEMARAASLGAELFVIDAGWYEGTGVAGPYDFDSGLGSWIPDPVRFPSGLRPLRDYAHQLGMKFGIWVEPVRVSLSMVGPNGLNERWLETDHGNYGSDHSAQLCLTIAAVRQYLFDQLTTLVDDVQPDYLKWDNNMWVNCDRAGHPHGATDGNFAHVTALYRLFAALQDRYPDLMIENVSGGGNHLDLGVIRYTATAWMDDRTAPAVHVRHNVEGLSAVFPPGYLLSFVVDSENEPLQGASDLPLIVRSRMQGALGLCFRTSQFTAADSAAVRREIAVYKSYRGVLAAAAGALLTPQVTEQTTAAWDVLQLTAMGGNEIVLTAFQIGPGSIGLTIKPTGLRAGTTYAVTSVDTGSLGTATGADLASKGIEVVASRVTGAHVLVLTATP